MSTIHDVARIAGVSTGTVSNVLNRPSYVSAETRRRVQQVIDELEFMPRARARQFRPGRARTFGISMANLDNPFFVDVALGAEEVIRRSDIGVVFCNSAYDAEREANNLDLLVQQRVQGIVIAPVDENSSRIVSLRDRGVPMVFVDRVGEDQNCWSVVVDDFRGGRIGARHLIERGHRRIAFAGHPDKSYKVRRRLEGVTAAVRRAPKVSLELFSTASWTIEAGRSLAHRLADLAPGDRPTAVLCANDMLALGLLHELPSVDIAVPDQLAVVGYDNLEWSELSTPALTTVGQPRRELGRSAVTMMMKLVEDPRLASESNHVVLTPRLVVRGTT